jgi:hypothetical protein
MSGTGIWLRRLAVVLLTLVLAAAVLTARVVVDGEQEMRLSDEAFHAGDVRTATLHARRAAVLYAPGAPHVRPAYDRLVAVALGAEAAGETDVARTAWRAVRGAALETRHLWIPHQVELNRANRNLARLQTVSAKTGSDGQPEFEQALAKLGRDDAPRALWVMLLALGFACAIVGLALLGWRGVTPAGKITLANAKLGLVLALLGAACWTLAVFRA